MATGEAKRLMARATQCPQCGVVLRVPAEAMGRRLKCPKCGTKFEAAEAGPVSPHQPPPSATSVAVVAPPSSMDLPSIPARREEGMPMVEADLRDAFDLPLLGEAGSSSPRASAGAGADVMGLFQEAPRAPRKKTGAEARMQARRCPTCGGYVPAGMSLCNGCNTDLDTGTRINLEESFEDALPSMGRGESIPIGIAAVGGVSLILSVALACFALVQWRLHQVDGTQYLALICLFGVYGSVQFLRGKSVKLLITALTIGAAVNVVGLIALPVFQAAETKLIENSNPSDETAEDVRIEAAEVDTNKITWGIVILLVYAGVVVYLFTPGVRRYFDKPRAGGPLSLTI